MALPAIHAYDIPVLPDPSERHVDWQFSSGRGALLVHDMQRYFVRAFPDGSSPMLHVIANIKLLIDRCRHLTIPIIYSAQPGGMTPHQRGLLRDFWGDGMRIDPEDRRIIDCIAPQDGDLVIDKWRYSAFVSNDLAEHLSSRGIDQLAVCGIYAHIGCLMTVADAFQKDIKPFLISDAVADFSRDYHDLALRYAAERCASVKTTRRLIADLDRFDVA